MGKDDRASFPGFEAKLLAQRGHRAGNGYARDLDPRRLRDSGGSGLAYTFNNYFVVDFPGKKTVANRAESKWRQSMRGRAISGEAFETAFTRGVVGW